jgi:hypothetical protein
MFSDICPFLDRYSPALKKRPPKNHGIESNRITRSIALVFYCSKPAGALARGSHAFHGMEVALSRHNRMDHPNLEQNLLPLDWRIA